MKNLKSKDFWDKALARALRTFLQSGLAVFGTTTLITDADWKLVVSTAVTAAILSLANSVIAGLPECNEA